MLGDREYAKGPPMILWNPYINRFQISRPGIRVCKPTKNLYEDYSNIYFVHPMRAIFDAGFIIIHKLSEDIITHPSLVLRRQCQVNCSPKNFHVFPHTLLPSIFYLHKYQNNGVLWKGIGSIILLKAISFYTEQFLSARFLWPKKINIFDASVGQIWRHFLLKWWTFIIITPYYAITLANTVHSDTALDAPCAIDVLVKGTYCLLHWGMPRRMLPMWYMACPFAIYHISRYFLHLLVVQFLQRYIFRSRSSKLRLQNIAYLMVEQDQRFYCSLFSNIVSDVLLYPAETLIHRCLSQGAGITIDNLDTGSTLLPICTSYKGVGDCCQTCFNLQGKCSFYAGIGSLFFHYGSFILFAQFGRYILLNLFLTFHKHFIVKYSPREIFEPSERTIKIN